VSSEIFLIGLSPAQRGLPAHAHGLQYLAFRLPSVANALRDTQNGKCLVGPRVRVSVSMVIATSTKAPTSAVTPIQK